MLPRAHQRTPRERLPSALIRSRFDTRTSGAAARSRRPVTQRRLLVAEGIGGDAEEWRKR
ncbi:hypothetical protein CZ774_02940 [Frigoribacterium sp. JB110]|nr:hypothetical protein CZ774_02940 [Frigoribacterium sp. JB110]